MRTGLGEGSLGQYRNRWADIEPDFVAQDVYDAAKWIVDSEEKRQLYRKTVANTGFAAHCVRPQMLRTSQSPGTLSEIAGFSQRERRIR